MPGLSLAKAKVLRRADLCQAKAVRHIVGPGEAHTT